MMPGMPDLSQILMQAQQMQADMERAQASLAEAEVTGHAGNGLVTVVVNGSGDLQRIRIDPSVVDPADVETLEDLVIAAVHDARRAAEELAGDAMGSVAGGLDLSSMGLGGMGFPGFGVPAEIEGEEDDDADYLDDDEDEDDDDDMNVDEEVAVIEESRARELPRPGAADLPATTDPA